MGNKDTMLEAQALASRLDAKLRATDKRLSGSVFLAHQDGSVFLFDRAFVQIWKKDFAIILTEHHGPHVYYLEDLKHLRAMGPRVHIKNLTAK